MRTGDPSSDTTTNNTPKELIEISNDADWERECGVSSGYRGLCAIGVFDKYTAITSTSTTNTNTNTNIDTSRDWYANIDTYQSIVNTMTRDTSTTNTALSAFKFVYLDGNCQGTFIESLFGISGIYYNIPTIIVYSPSKKRYALYTPSSSSNGHMFDNSDVQNFLNSIIKGTTTTIPLPSSNTNSNSNSIVANMHPNIVCKELYTQRTQTHEQKHMDINGNTINTDINIDTSSDSGVNSEEMDDFMEEIRREEEENRNRILLEVEQERLDILKIKEETEAATKEKSGPRKIKRVVKKKKKKSV